MRHAEARRLASFYTDPRTPHGQTLTTFVQGFRVPRAVLADALEIELAEAQQTGNAAAEQELETLIEYCWA
jgi:hypothetical protein